MDMFFDVCMSKVISGRQYNIMYAEIRGKGIDVSTGK